MNVTIATFTTAIQQRLELVMRGAYLANKGMNLMKNCLVAHSVMQVPLTK